MIFKKFSFTTPIQNILFDDVLLSLAEKGDEGESLRFWESEQLFIVVGRIGKIEEELFVDNILRDRIPVLRRSSGGGTVLQGPGCLNYSVILSKEKNPFLNDIRQSYEIILDKVINALQKLHLKTIFMPISDLVILDNKKKFSGNAQRRGKKFILHHGTLLYDFNIDLVTRYLPIPPNVPSYRDGRAHKEFLSNVRINKEHFIQYLKEEFAPFKIDKFASKNETILLEEFIKEGRYRTVIF